MDIMKPIVVTYTTQHLPTERLINSCKNFGWPIHVIYENVWTTSWRRWHRIYDSLDLLKEDYSHAIIVDAWDTVVVRPISEFKVDHPLIICAENNCYPDGRLADLYPKVSSPFKYVNSPFCINLHQNPPSGFRDMKIEDDPDQLYLTKFYLKNTDKIKLDSNCEVFQSLYHFDDPNNFESNLTNKITGTRPFFFHGNGKANMGWISI